jgi:hypothetical protein
LNKVYETCGSGLRYLLNKVQVYDSVHTVYDTCN